MTATPLDLEAMRERYPIAPDAGDSMVQAARPPEMGKGIQNRFLQKSEISPLGNLLRIFGTAACKLFSLVQLASASKHMFMLFSQRTC